MIKFLKRLFGIKDAHEPKPGLRLPMRPVFVARPAPERTMQRVPESMIRRDEDFQSQSATECTSAPDILTTSWPDLTSLYIGNSIELEPSSTVGGSTFEGFGGGDAGGGGTSDNF